MTACCSFVPQIIRTSFGKVPLREVLDTHRFDMGGLQQSAGWIAEINQYEAEAAAGETLDSLFPAVVTIPIPAGMAAHVNS